MEKGTGEGKLRKQVLEFVLRILGNLHLGMLSSYQHIQQILEILVTKTTKLF